MSEPIHSRTERRKQQEAAGRSKKKDKKPKSTKGIIKKIFLTVVLLGLAVFIGGIGLFAFYASSAPELDESLLKDPLSSDIADKNGNVFYTSGTEKREFVPYDEIPELMENAILATEDVRFYSHYGMDFWRLGGAVLANFKDGFGSQGASTITQQVIKNSFLSEEKTLKRKAQEAWLAFQLERHYEKEEIFEMYFNKILMSGNRFGFGTASEYFYGKKLDELELHEVAMLAGLPQSPNGYNPSKNPERAEKRRNTVLGLMYQHKKITKAQMDEARAIPVTATLLTEEQRMEKGDNTKYAAFVDLVLEELEAADMGHLISEGITIQTTLDPDAQKSVENALQSDIYADDKMQAALTVLDTKTGEIVAIGGGRNYAAGGLNFATHEKRQPGSAIKPIIDYAPAIEYLNWSTGQTLVDEPYNYKGSKPAQAVRNVDRKYKGAITMRDALYNSRNVPAVKTYEEVGRGKAVDFAATLGLKFSNDYPSNALGGTDEFSTAQLAGAYAAFGNNGVYTKPHAIKTITYRDGKTKKNLAPKPVIAMKDSTAYMITDMLRDVLSAGTGTRAAVRGVDVAGKTGTTNFAEKSGAKDSWFAGYSTNYTIAAWGGYQDRSPMTKMAGERYVPQDLFKKVMSDISAGKNTARFKKPSSVVEATIQVGTNPLALASASTPSNLKRTELFVRGTLPKETAKEEVVVGLEAPSGLTAKYDEGTNSIALTWSHNAPESEDETEAVQFTVAVSVDGGGPQEMITTSDLAVTFPGVETGRTYTFTVTAKLGDLQSAPSSTTLMVQGNSMEEPEPEPDPDEDNSIPEAPDNGNGNNGNGNNGNGNNGNNGNGNGNNNNGNNNNGNNGGDNGNSETPLPPIEGGSSDNDGTDPVIPDTGGDSTPSGDGTTTP
ncbi:PBP1A family penicillin-binding protein [Sporosarcina sp. FSL K6-1522]|uniref:PBP1A family penicillin-binding protein n=1 Tax=Sporosarcina sp. FSL K6-1522 TaxID=2921554 RepID=UPI003159AF33